jgi:two-component system chemotaxis sensor kinase CheA
MNCIFRALHTIKGTSSFLGFDPIVQLGHRAEDVLNALRRHDLPVTRSLMDALLAARDQLGKMLVDLRAGGLKQKYPIEKLIADLEKVQKGETTSTTAVESRPEESVPAPGAEHPQRQNRENLRRSSSKRLQPPPFRPCGWMFASLTN